MEIDKGFVQRQPEYARELHKQKYRIIKKVTTEEKVPVISFSKRFLKFYNNNSEPPEWAKANIRYFIYFDKMI